MKGFFTVLKWNFLHLFQNRYTLLFFILSLLPVLVCIFIQIDPTLVQNTRKVFPHEIEFDTLDSPQEKGTENTPPYKIKIVPLSKNEILLFLSYRFLLGFILLFGLCCLGSKAIGEEVEMGTLQMLFLRPVSRKTIYLSKVMALSLTGFTIAILPLILMFLILFGLKIESDIFFAMIFIYFLGILAYSSVFLLTGMFKGGLYLALLYAFFWEFMVVSITERARKFAISHYLESMIFDVIGQKSDYMSFFSESALTLFIASLVLLVAGVLYFEKREFTFSH